MIPVNELKSLANALMNTPEYKNVMRNRNTIKGNPPLYKQTVQMERSRNQVLNSNMPAQQKQRMMAEQMQKYQTLMKNPNVINLSKSMESYQNMFKDCITYINKIIDSNMR